MRINSWATILFVGGSVGLGCNANSDVGDTESPEAETSSTSGRNTEDGGTDTATDTDTDGATDTDTDTDTDTGGPALPVECTGRLLIVYAEMMSSTFTIAGEEIDPGRPINILNKPFCVDLIPHINVQAVVALEYELNFDVIGGVGRYPLPTQDVIMSMMGPDGGGWATYDPLRQKEGTIEILSIPTAEDGGRLSIRAAGRITDWSFDFEIAFDTVPVP